MPNDYQDAFAWLAIFVIADRDPEAAATIENLVQDVRR
jgi:hypothetical protein